MTYSPTKEKILDTAERLFARSGFHSTSLRTITAEAGVNLAAVNYHFGSKNALIEEVFKRRLKELNGERVSRLEKVRAKAVEQKIRPGLEATIRAFIEPTMLLLRSEQGACFITIVARAMMDPNPRVRRIFLQEMEGVLSLFFETLQSALPHIPSDILFCRFQFMLGVMGHTLFNAGKPRWSPRGMKTDTEEPGILFDRLIAFVKAGMEAPVE